jgi:hypothetical protein
MIEKSEFIEDRIGLADIADQVIIETMPRSCQRQRDKQKKKEDWSDTHEGEHPFRFVVIVVETTLLFKNTP